MSYPASTAVLQAVLDAVNGTLDPSSQIADHPNVKFVQLRLLKQQDVIDALRYAMRSGCFFPVPEPQPPYQTEALVQWGAMRNLHRAIAALDREGE